MIIHQIDNQNLKCKYGVRFVTDCDICDLDLP